MRSRRSAHDDVAEVARRRLELLSAELAGIRPVPGDHGPEPDRELGAPEHLHRHDLPPQPAPGGARRAGSHAIGTPRAPAAPAPSVPAAEPGRHAHRSVGVGPSVAGWLQDRLPPTLQGRWAMTSAHVVVVALLVACGVGLSLWWVARADGDSAPVPAASGSTVTGGPGGALVTPAPVPSAAAAAVPGAAAPTAGVGTAGSTPTTGSAAAGIVVDVAGKVRRPGIATLPSGSRVVDALEAAGGARRGARLGSLNLARVLTDGEQIVVGLPAVSGVAAPAAASSGAGSGAAGSSGPTALVPLNTATQAQLEELPGVGPVTAQSILDYRSENGAFTSVDELLEVSGIGDATLAKIAPYVTL